MTQKAARVALITGAARGIGRAIASAFDADHQIAGSWSTTAPDGFLPHALWMQADLSDPAAHKALVEDTLARFGRIDVIVNNAGAIAMSPLDHFDFDAGRHIFDVNVLAAHGLLCAALPHLNAGASIVSISSINASLPPGGAVLYGASKAALDLWTRGMAKELGPRGIRVNAVAPGAVERAEAPRDPDLVRAFTEQTALGTLASPADIADAVRFLASDQATSITGETLTVSGGYRL
ncbi:MAG: SDR family oxidoreductase [Rhodobacteraceae bacterium]|nr:SDR family oxidoreductase [Paracoccaceae bacterium]